MTHSFQEFSSSAVFHIGDRELLNSFDRSQPAELYTFIWTQNKGIDLLIDHVPIRLQPYSILSLTPNQYLQLSTEETLIVYRFNREFYCIKDHDQEVSCVGLLFYGNHLSPVVELDSGEQCKFEQLHAVFMDEIQTKDTIQAEMLRMLMARFIIKTTRLLKAQTTKPTETSFKHSDLLRQFNFLVEQHFKQEHKVSFYAEKMFKSPKTLSNAFAKQQLSPLQLIHKRLILETKRQLMYTDKSAKQIAFDLGFEDASHLSRLFKKHTGSSPSHFKEGHLSSVKH
jgi:AraC-like DNA-binding protein